MNTNAEAEAETKRGGKGKGPLARRARALRPRHAWGRATWLLSQAWGQGGAREAEERPQNKGSSDGAPEHKRPQGTTPPRLLHLREVLSATSVNPGPRALPLEVQVYPPVFGSTLPAAVHTGQTQRQASVTLPTAASKPHRMTLAVVHQGRQGLQSYLGVIGPHQEAPECQAALEAQIHTLIVLQLQLKNGNKRTAEYSHPGALTHVLTHVKSRGRGDPHVNETEGLWERTAPSRYRRSASGRQDPESEPQADSRTHHSSTGAQPFHQDHHTLKLMWEET